MRQLTPQRRDTLWDFMSEVERAFDQAWNTSDIAGRSHRRTELPTFAPAVDLHETKDFYLISVDVPGIDQNNIKVDVEDGRLTVSGERTREEHKEDGMFQRFEKSYGRFVRSFQLPQNIDEGKIQARSENGVLEIMVPKTEQAKPRSVQIEAGKGGLFSKLVGNSKKSETQSDEEKKH